MITDRINVDSITEIFAYDSNFIKYRQKKDSILSLLEILIPPDKVCEKLSSNQFYSLQ